METIPKSNASETIVDLPISKIKENPDNPRHVITPEMIETMAASLKAVGLLNPIKVRRVGRQSAVDGRQDGEPQKSGEEALSGTEVASSLTPAYSAGIPRNDSRNYDMVKEAPCNDGGDEYELISGHIRLAGAKMLGWATLKALVKDVTPQEALLEAILDNRGQEMTWLDLYQSIESLMKADSNQTQQEVGDKLEIDRSVVSRALKLLELLNPYSRELICENFTKPDGYQVPESCVRRLTDLSKSSKTQKTRNNAENTQNELQNLIERALGVVFRHKMTEAQVGKMVTKILKTGVTPEEYEAGLGQSASDGPDDPNASLWESLPETLKIHKTPQGYKLAWTLSDAEAPVAVYGAMAWLEHLKYDAKLGTPDLSYMKALPKMTHQNKGAYAQEHEDRTKAVEQKRVEEENRKAATEARAQQKVEAKAQREAEKQAKADKVSSQSAVGSPQAGERQQTGEAVISGTEVAASLTPAYSAGTPRNDSGNYDVVKEAPRNDRPEKAPTVPSETTIHYDSQEKSPEIPTANPKETVSAPALAQGGILGAVMQAVKNRVGSSTQEVESNVANAVINDAERAANNLVRQGFKKMFKDLF